MEAEIRKQVEAEIEAKMRKKIEDEMKAKEALKAKELAKPLILLARLEPPQSFIVKSLIPRDVCTVQQFSLNTTEWYICSGVDVKICSGADVQKPHSWIKPKESIEHIMRYTNQYTESTFTPGDTFEIRFSSLIEVREAVSFAYDTFPNCQINSLVSSYGLQLYMWQTAPENQIIHIAFGSRAMCEILPLFKCSDEYISCLKSYAVMRGGNTIKDVFELFELLPRNFNVLVRCTSSVWQENEVYKELVLAAWNQKCCFALMSTVEQRVQLRVWRSDNVAPEIQAECSSLVSGLDNPKNTWGIKERLGDISTIIIRSGFYISQ
jgi:hypothetical protein